MTDNRCVTRFFQTKIILATVWNALDHVLSLDIIQRHIPEKANLAADYMARIHINPKEKLEQLINSGVPMHEIEVYTTADTPEPSISYLSISEDDGTPKITKTYLLESKQPNKNFQNVQADVQLQFLAPAMHEQIPLDEFVTHGHGPLDVHVEQQDEDIKRVLL